MLRARPQSVGKAVAGLVARRIEVQGIVQGVGFRPFVYRLATRMGLAGEVSNHTGGVSILVQGPEAEVEAFVRDLAAQAPPASRVDSVSAIAAPVEDRSGFAIVPSERTAQGVIRVSPDIAVCADCLAEMLDPLDRRHGHPFINCTNCGPRFTIVNGVPYDRPRTSMSPFPMCARCQAEYENVADRRFHAQPVACVECGPRLSYHPGPCDDPLGAARAELDVGRIVAIKGIGGFHLACDAHSAPAVARLRQRKGRELKPLAVMFASLAAARRYAHIPEDAARLLSGPQAPIVLLPRRGNGLAPGVAPDTDSIGVLLPYAPVHVLLFNGLITDALIMTSGNLADEPICTDNGEAIARLGSVADGFLLHDREIVTGCDDSVIRWTPSGPIFLRRSRGYVPYPIALPDSVEPILAVGGDLKNTFCLTRGQDAYASQHIGDLGDERVLGYFEQQVQHLQELVETEPVALACDLHPDYLSTRWAEGYATAKGLPLIRVQHHYAHAAAVVAEHGVREPVVAIIADGTGLGIDGAVWGCELLLVDGPRWRRLGHLQTIRLPGGDMAAREAWRPCFAWLNYALGDLDEDALPEHLRNRLVMWPVLLAAMTAGINSPIASSAGRLFDAVACLLGVAEGNAYEGQAPMRLEMSAEDSDYPLQWSIRDGDPLILDPQPALVGLLRGLEGGHSIASLAGAFHRSFAEALVGAAKRLCATHRLGTVVISGGAFQNARMLAGVSEGLKREGLTPLWPTQSPPGDGGLALGQAVAASWIRASLTG